MSEVCERLKDVNEAGVYQLACSLEELHGYAAQAGFAVFEADLAQVQGKGEFLAAIARAIAAPDWFGHNFDALADSLCDVSWRPAPGYALVLCNGADTLGLSEAERGIAMGIFADTVTFWKSQGKPFWIFLF
ncbi:MAG: barstar family protein [Nitrosomonadales bacterium]|nr:barstar family protein [Nitrosomonadales bacterium]